MDQDRQPLLADGGEGYEQYVDNPEELFDIHKYGHRTLKSFLKANKEVKKQTGFSAINILKRMGSKKVSKYNVNMPEIDKDSDVDFTKDELELYIALIKLSSIAFGFGLEKLLEEDKMDMGSLSDLLKIAFHNHKLAKLMHKIPKDISYLNDSVIKFGFSEDMLQEKKDILDSFINKKSKNKKIYKKARKIANDEEKKVISNLKKYLNIEDKDIGPLFIQHRDYEPTFIITKHDAGTIGNKNKTVIVTFRGSSVWSDWIMDLDFKSISVKIEEEEYFAHEGMLRYSLVVMKYLSPLLQNYKEEGFDIIITGHSLGASVAVITTCLLKHIIPSVRAVVFASPCCISKKLSEKSENYVKNIVFSTDMVSRLGLYQILETGFIFKQIKKKEPINVESIDNILDKAGYSDTCLYVPKTTYLLLLDEENVWSFTDYYPKSKGKKAHYDKERNYPVVVQKYFFDGKDMHMPLHPTQGSCHLYHQVLFCCYSLLKKCKTMGQKETSSEKEIENSSEIFDVLQHGEE